jgi:DNA-binding CsgD family transcriptional regulator/pimeloyl-ACP methyl ester carboxylesterase
MEAPPVQYVKTSDGYNIAYAVSGQGQPLIFIPPGFMNLRLYWQHYPEWMQGLAERFRLIVYDHRGEGLSTRGLPQDTGLEDYERDLETLVDHFLNEPIVFLTLGARGHFAVRYAAAHPDRVRAIVWFTAHVANAWPEGIFGVTARQNWDLFLHELAPRGLGPEEQDRYAAEYSRSINLEDYLIFYGVHHNLSVERELTTLRVPMLVVTQDRFMRVPPEEPRRVAEITPDAQYVSIGGDTLYGDHIQGLAAIDSFIANLSPHEERVLRTRGAEIQDALSDREVEVLRLIAQGKSNPEIAKELFITRNTVQNHVSAILIKTNLNNRAQAAVYAQQHGIV